MDYRQITTERKFKDCTGYDKSSFEKLLDAYQATYKELKGQTYEEYLEENVMEQVHLKTLGEALFFVLFQMKNDLIFGTLATIFNMSVSSASKNFKYFLKLLEQTLEKKSDAKA